LRSVDNIMPQMLSTERNSYGTWNTLGKKAVVISFTCRLPEDCVSCS